MGECCGGVYTGYTVSPGDWVKCDTFMFLLWVVGWGTRFCNVGYTGYTGLTGYNWVHWEHRVHIVTFDVFNRFAPPYPPNHNLVKTVCQIFFYLCENFLKKVTVKTMQGDKKEYRSGEIKFSYRHSTFSPDEIVISAEFE